MWRISVCFLLWGIAVTSLANTYRLPKPDAYLTAVAPIVAYDPAYGSLLGVAWFSYPTGDVTSAKRQQQLQFISRIGPHASLSYQLQSPQQWGPWGISTQLALDNFYDYKIVDSQVSERRERWSIQSAVFLHRQLSSRWSMSLGPTFFYEQQQLTEKSHTWWYPSIKFSYDSRDQRLNSQKGQLISTEFRWQAAEMHSTAEQDSWQVLQQSSWFMPLLFGHQLAVNHLAQFSNAQQLQSSAGGDRLLRGYYQQQFESQHLLASQVEYRFHIIAFIHGVFFSDSILLLDSQDDWEVNKVDSYGAGLLIALPPDQSMSVRLDLGFNSDGEALTYLNFNHVF